GTAADVAFYGEAVEKCVWRLLSGKDALYTVEIDQVQAIVDVRDSRFGYGAGLAIPNQRSIAPHFDAKFLSTDAARPREIDGCEFNRRASTFRHVRTSSHQRSRCGDGNGKRDHPRRTRPRLDCHRRGRDGWRGSLRGTSGNQHNEQQNGCETHPCLL